MEEVGEKMPRLADALGAAFAEWTGSDGDES